jgi:hypothetical protein
MAMSADMKPSARENIKLEPLSEMSGSRWA